MRCCVDKECRHEKSVAKVNAGVWEKKSPLEIGKTSYNIP
jgi:hypothetical protein